MKKITTSCPECGTEFSYYPSWPRKYCSRRCSGLNNARNLGAHLRGERADVTCVQCGTTISRNRFEIEKSDQHFCSRACFGAYLKASLTGIARPEQRGERPDLQKRVEKVCQRCGKTFKVKASHADRRVMCSKACQRSQVEKICEICGKTFSVCAATKDPARFCSKTCHIAHQATLRGPETNNWKGGYIGRYGPNWKQQRRNARHRDQYTCQRCGITETQLGQQLDVHHITPFRVFGLERHREANTLSNLICYCPTCHKQVENHAPFGAASPG